MVVGEFPVPVRSVDQPERPGRQILAQCDVVDDSATGDAKRRGGDRQVRWDSGSQRVPHSRGCVARLPYLLVEISHHDQALRRRLFEHFRKTDQVLLMIFPRPAPYTIVCPPRPRRVKGDTDADHRYRAQRSRRYAGHEPPGRHRGDPEVIDLLPGLAGPENHLSQCAGGLHSVRLGVDRMASLVRKQHDVRFGETDHVRPCRSMRRRISSRRLQERGVAHSTFQVTTVADI